MNAICTPSYDPEFMGDCWYLGHIKELKLHRFLQCVKQIEWDHQIQRVRASHIMRSREGEAIHFVDRDGEAFRLRDDLFRDTIEFAAERTIRSYRDLPVMLSCLDDVYLVSPCGTKIRKELRWTVCAYGVMPDALVPAATKLAGRPSVRSETSRAVARMQDNTNQRVPVTVMDWTLIET